MTAAVAKPKKPETQPAGKQKPEKHGQAALVAQFMAARRRGVPLIAVTTPDPAATVRAINLAINANDAVAKVGWDIVRGLSAYNEPAANLLAQLGDDVLEGCRKDSLRPLEVAEKFPAGTVLYYQQASRWLADSQYGPLVMQGIWNLRDQFKDDKRTLVLIAPDLVLPAELQGDVVVLDEPLPKAEELAAIVQDICESARIQKLEEPQVAKAVEALQGLPAFQAEQVTAMSVTAGGLDYDALWERKRKSIEQTPGLSVYRGGDKFADIGGVEAVKAYTRRLVGGRSRPNAIIWLDEVEKAMAGTKGDTSGVSQDYLGTLLSYMEDHGCYGMIFTGPPGAAKSAVAKAAGNEAGVPTIRLDLGGMKGSLVGESEAKLRQALKVITSVSNDRSLWIATSNSVANLDTALLRRFPDVWMFDLPTREEKDVIWGIWKKRYGLESEPNPADEGWVGANIQKACEKAWRLDCPLAEAAQYIIPVGRSAAAEIEALRRQAHGKYLSASKPGAYEAGEAAIQTTGQLKVSKSGGRKMDLED